MAEKSFQKLNKKEREAKEFIELAFKPHQGEWKKTSERLLDFFKGKYHMRTEQKDRFTVNSAFSLVNLLLPNFVLQMPHIRVRPKNSKYFKKLIDGNIQQINNLKWARIREAAINHDYAKIKAIDEDRKAVQDSFFYGFGITKTGYSFETISSDDKDYVLKDQIFHKRVNPKDFGWHPLATGVDDSTMLVHRLVTTKDKLAEKYKGKGVEDIPGEVPEHLKDKMKDIKKSNFLSVYEVHNQEDDKIYTYVGEAKKLVDKKDREYKFNGSDFSIIKFTGDNDDFLGIPFLAMVEDEMIAINEVMTLIIEHMRKFPGQVFFENGSIDEDDLERIRNGEQGSIHGVNDPSKLVFKQPLNMGGEYFNIISLLQGTIDRTLGIPDFQRLTSTTRKSATEASFMQGDATVRRNYFLKIVKDFVLDGVEKVAALQQQFQDEKVETTVSGEWSEPITWDKSDIQGEAQFDFDVDNMAAFNQADTNNLLQLLNVLGTNPVWQPVIATLSPFKFAKRLFKLANLNLEEFETEEPENVVHVPPEKENEIARRGDPMPQPKKGEDFEYHIKTHMDDLKMKGPNESIIQHLAETLILQERDTGKPAQVQQPAPQAQGLPELMAPPGPGQMDNLQ